MPLRCRLLGHRWKERRWGIVSFHIRRCGCGRIEIRSFGFWTVAQGCLAIEMWDESKPMGRRS